MEERYLQNDLETFASLSGILLFTFSIIQLRIDGEALQKVRDLMHKILVFFKDFKNNLSLN